MIAVNIIIFFLFAFLFILTRKYKREWVNTLDAKKYQLKPLYPLSLYLLNRLERFKVNFQDKGSENQQKEIFRAVYVGENTEEKKQLYNSNKVALILLLLLVFNVFSTFTYFKDNNLNNLVDGKFIKRPLHTENTKQLELQVKIMDEDSFLLEDSIQITLTQKEYTLDEVMILFKDATQYIDSVILNQNVSAEEINSNLKFVSKIPNSKIKVEWSTGDVKIIDQKGNVFNDRITENMLVPVTATLIYKDITQEYTRYFKVVPKTYSVEEQIKKNLNDVLQEAMENSELEKYLQLPEKIEGYKIGWYEPENTSSINIFIFGIIVAFVVFWAMEYELKEKLKKRNQELLLDYSGMVSKFSLLVGAGLSVSNAWEKIIEEYKTSVDKRFVYEEMLITYGELMIGTSEDIAYEKFGRRIKLIPYLRFSSLLAQNVKKGSSNLLGQLEVETMDAFAERKEYVKRLGEEAGTKLLVPMMFMLILVLIIIIVPAFMSFQI